MNLLKVYNLFLNYSGKKYIVFLGVLKIFKLY